MGTSVRYVSDFDVHLKNDLEIPSFGGPTTASLSSILILRSLSRNAFDNLFKSNKTLSNLRDAALADHLLSASSSALVPGRSLAWKVALILQHVILY